MHGLVVNTPVNGFAFLFCPASDFDKCGLSEQHIYELFERTIGDSWPYRPLLPVEQCAHTAKIEAE